MFTGTAASSFNQVLISNHAKLITEKETGYKPLALDMGSIGKSKIDG